MASSKLESGPAAEVSEGTLLSALLSISNPGPRDNTYKMVRRGTQKLIDDILRSEEDVPKIDKELVNAMIADIDRRLTEQVNAILQHPDVKRLETAWRGLKYLVDQIDFSHNIALEIVSATKEELRVDFEDAADITKSGLYTTVYSDNFGVLGGKPYGVICSTYDFDASSEDIALLKQCAAVGAVAHTPFLGNAAPSLFGLSSFTELPRLKDVPALFDGPTYSRWNALRDSEDARCLGLCMPRFLLRTPYGEPPYVPPDSPAYVPGASYISGDPVTAFEFREDVVDRHERYLWGPASIALTARIAHSFAQYRWCPNIVGAQGGGAVSGLPLHVYEQNGELKVKDPTEVALDDHLERDLAEQGLIGLVYRKHSDNAVFYSANSLQRPRIFPRTPEGQAAQLSYTLGTRLPYSFIVNRLGHYMKVLQREQIGTWKTRADLERELNQWIRAYVSDMPDPPPETRSRKPLRSARITVEEVPGQNGWFRCGLTVRPHLRVEGVEFDLGLVGKLDRV